MLSEPQANWFSRHKMEEHIEAVLRFSKRNFFWPSCLLTLPVSKLHVTPDALISSASLLRV